MTRGTMATSNYFQIIAILLIQQCLFPVLFLKILLECNCFTMLCLFLLFSKVSPLYTDMSPPCGLPSHSGRQRALSRAPRGHAVGSHQASVSRAASVAWMCWPLSPNPIPPSPHPLGMHTPVLCACLYFCSANKILSTIFLDSTHTH